jgi:hypothetical protein
VASATPLQVRPALWIDTNVMLEIFTFGDLFRELLKGEEARKTAERSSEPVSDFFSLAKARRLKVKNSLWFAMALCHQHATTISFYLELSRNSLRVAPPGSRSALPTKALFNALLPNGLFDGWTIETRSIGEELSTRRRDRLMGEICLAEGLDFISRDSEARTRAAAKGVRALEPEDGGQRTHPYESRLHPPRPAGLGPTSYLMAYRAVPITQPAGS